jgi:autotransporter-associated beta strand protein
MDGGTLQIGNLVTLADRAVTLYPGGGTFSLDQVSYLTITNDISGPGALNKAGPGALVLNGAITSTGPVTVQGGTLYVDGAMSGPGSVTVYSGGTLGGNGSILGDLTVQDGGTLAPGTNDVHGSSTLTVSNLMLGANAILRMNLNAPGVLGGTNDFVLVHGDLTLDGILKVSGYATKGIYPLIKYDGVLTDNGMQLGPAVNGSLIVDTASKTISLNAVSFPPAPPMPMRMFFIGNSLTYYYDIPGTVAGMAAAAGDWFTYASDLVGGSTLLDHLSNPTTMALIDSGAFDIVMLQEYSNRSTIPNDRDNLMYPAARTFNAHIIAQGQRTMFYETWGYPTAIQTTAGCTTPPCNTRAAEASTCSSPSAWVMLVLQTNSARPFPRSAWPGSPSEPSAPTSICTTILWGTITPAPPALIWPPVFIMRPCSDEPRSAIHTLDSSLTHPRLLTCRTWPRELCFKIPGPTIRTALRPTVTIGLRGGPITRTGASRVCPA